MKFIFVLLCLLLNTAICFGQEVFVLEYHQIVQPSDGIDVSDTAVTVEQFSAQMKWLHDNGYTTITGAELVAYMNGNYKVKHGSKSVVLSFDDGWSNQQNSLPIMKKYGFKGTFSIIASYPGRQSGYMTWNEIRELVKAGHDVESHSMTHPENMDGSYYFTEINLSKVIIEQQINKKVTLIAWPNGKFNPTMVALAKQASYQGAMTIDQDWCTSANKPLTTCESRVGNDVGQDSFSIKRFYIDGRCTVDEFSEWVKQGHTSECAFNKPQQ